MIHSRASSPCNCSGLRGGDDARSAQTLGLFVVGLIATVLVIGIASSKVRR